MSLAFLDTSLLDDQMCITIPIADDDFVESSESLIVTLSLDDGSELASTTVTILDNDGMFPLSWCLL